MTDAELSVKQLHNGEPIQSFADKFKTTIRKSKADKPLTDQLPKTIAQAAKQIPSSHLGWNNPILKYDADSKTWYLLALTKVVYTDKNTSSVDHIVSDESVTRLIQRSELNALYQTILSD